MPKPRGRRAIVIYEFDGQILKIGSKINSTFINIRRSNLGVFIVKNAPQQDQFRLISLRFELFCILARKLCSL
jgi:hypothetical protein